MPTLKISERGMVFGSGHSCFPIRQLPLSNEEHTDIQRPKGEAGREIREEQRSLEKKTSYASACGRQAKGIRECYGC